MNGTLTTISLALYLIVGIVSMLMAYKNIFSPKFLPFNEQASGKSWEEVDKNLQYVILALMKVAGLGFLMAGILLIVCPVYMYLNPETFLRYLVPLVAIPYCLGLFIFSFGLFKKTQAETPWKNSLLALVIIIISAILSII
jgi:hypothetical protein